MQHAYIAQKLEQHEAAAAVAANKLAGVRAQIDGVVSLARAHRIFPVCESTARLEALVSELEEALAQVQARTAAMDWAAVDMIGSRSGSLMHAVEGDLKQLLCKGSIEDEGAKVGSDAATATTDDAVLSAFVVSKDYREALAISSLADLEVVTASAAAASGVTSN